MVGENGVPVTPDFHVPVRTFCARLLGDDDCDCPPCQLDASLKRGLEQVRLGQTARRDDLLDEFPNIILGSE